MCTVQILHHHKLKIYFFQSYDQEMSEEVHLQLQELPEQWNNTKKLAVTVKQAVAPLQVIFRLGSI